MSGCSCGWTGGRNYHSFILVVVLHKFFRLNNFTASNIGTIAHKAITPKAMKLPGPAEKKSSKTAPLAPMIQLMELRFQCFNSDRILDVFLKAEVFCSFSLPPTNIYLISTSLWNTFMHSKPLVTNL